MTVRKKSKRSRRPAATARPSAARRSASERQPPKPAPAQADAGAGDPIVESALSLHQLFEQQTRQMLDSTDLDEEQKQNILVAMSCPCCGAGAMSYTAKLKR
jgi:hypothetical protein